MVCATTNNIMTRPTMDHHNDQMMTTKQQHGEDDDDFDMAMDEDDDSEEDSSQDDETSNTSASSTPNNNNANNKRPAPQALFLNFTSDLSPQKMNKKKTKPKKQTAYRVNGVNILNRNNLDSKTAIERIQRRRENHNHVERRRRDNINNTIFELSNIVPNAAQPGQKPNKGNILKLSLDYIKDLQAENNALKESLAQFTSSRPSSISPPLSAAITNTNTNTNINTTTTSPAAAAMTAVDETFSNNTFSHHHQQHQQHQQQSPSAPNSPNRFIRSTTFTQQQHQHHHHQQQQSVSVPSSPLHTIHNMNMPKEDTIHSNNLPPPLALPPPHHHQPQLQQQQHQHLQNVFSTMSVSSNASSASSTPILSATVMNPYPAYPTNNTYPSPSPPPQQQQASIYIPQPPQLYNNEVFNTQQPQQHKQQQGLRPLLPATKPPHPPAIQQHQTSFLPALRMSGYEKIYGNVCRY